jgi:hypothetical protein
VGGLAEEESGRGTEGAVMVTYDLQAVRQGYKAHG